jgi:hypothetical protein
MVLLDDLKRQRIMEVLHEYLAAGPGVNGKTPVEEDADLDRKRIAVIENDLKPLLNSFIGDTISLADFKSRIDSINKRNEHWGFNGIKGQMFFNMVVNVADNQDECAQEMKAAIAIPENDLIASSRIKTFASYVKRLGEQWVDAGNTRYGTPKPGSIPFFLSYFWQIQNEKVWPVYYTNSVQVMTDLNLWQPKEDLSGDYLSFKQIHEELIDTFSKETGQPFDLYKVAHVFWYKGNPPEIVTKIKDMEPTGKASKTLAAAGAPATDIDRLPESYIPPIISILPRIARNEESLNKAAELNWSGKTGQWYK